MIGTNLREAYTLNPKTEEEAYTLLLEVSQWEYKPLEVQAENSGIKNLIDKRIELRQELSRISDNKKAATDYLKNSFGYSDEARQQEIRLESINLFNDSGVVVDDNYCPLCDSKISISIPTIEAINKSLLQIKEDLKHTKIESPRIQSYIDSVNGEYSKVETELRTIEQNITALYVENEQARTLRDLNIRRGKIIGRVSLFLESNVGEISDETINNKIESLKRKISELEKQVDTSDEKEKLNSIINKINLQMSKWVNELDVEYEDSPIRFDLSKLTLFVDTDVRPIALPNIGSGANWVAYHLLILFGLHKHFIQNNRPVPRFLIIDQPTQVYYPPEKSAELVEISSDEIAVNKMFEFIFRTVKSLSPNFQVIITDHAFLNNKEFKDSIVEVWRGGTKLIPSDWEKL